MKKFLPFIVVILLLAAGATWFMLHRTSGTIDKEEDAFAVKNKKDITKVILADNDHKRVELTKVNGVWMANGKYVAREDLVVQLFDVISRIKTLCPVPKAGHDYVVRSLLEKNIRVEVYTDDNAHPTVAYYVGGPTPDGNGTYMLREVDGKPDERPFITYLPGLMGYLTPRYQTDVEIWRSRVMFKYTPGDIKSFSLEYPAEENKSFSITQVAKDSFSLSPFNPQFAINQPYQQKFVQQYLEFYSSISFETFDNTNPTKDSVVHTTTPFCIFTITDKDNKVNKAKLFYQPVNKRSKMPWDANGKPMAYDVDHYFASINNDQDFTVVQYYVFGKLLRSYQDFFFKPGTVAIK